MKGESGMGSGVGGIRVDSLGACGGARPTPWLAYRGENSPHRSARSLLLGFGSMETATFSDFGAEAPVTGRRLTRAAVASLVLGLLTPVSCAGSVFFAAGAFDALAYRSAIAFLALPIVLAAVGLFLGGLGMWRVASRPQARKGMGLAAAGIALNLLGGSMGGVLSTQIVRLGGMASGTAEFMIRSAQRGDRARVDEVLHESARAALTDGQVEAFALALEASLGEVRHGPRSIGELARGASDAALGAARGMKGEEDLPAIPMEFARGRALVMLRVDRDAMTSLSRDLLALRGRVSLRGLVTDVRVVDERGGVIALSGGGG